MADAVVGVDHGDAGEADHDGAADRSLPDRLRDRVVGLVAGSRRGAGESGQSCFELCGHGARCFPAGLSASLARPESFLGNQNLTAT